MYVYVGKCAPKVPKGTDFQNSKQMIRRYEIYCVSLLRQLGNTTESAKELFHIDNNIDAFDVKIWFTLP